MCVCVCVCARGGRAGGLAQRTRVCVVLQIGVCWFGGLSSVSTVAHDIIFMTFRPPSTFAFYANKFNVASTNTRDVLQPKEEGATMIKLVDLFTNWAYGSTSTSILNDAVSCAAMQSCSNHCRNGCGV